MPILVFLMCLPSLAADLKIVKHLQSVSVSVATKEGRGSGTIFTRMDSNGHLVNFVWTAAHVVTHTPTNQLNIPPFFVVPPQLREPNPLDKEHRIDTCKVYTVGVIDGITSVTNVVRATLIKYDKHQDLALLRIDDPALLTEDSVKFYLDKEIPATGTELYSVSSPQGRGFEQTFGVGLISFVGRINDRNKLVMDQTSLVIYPGSSGSGVFLSDGRFVGMVTIAWAPNINEMIPVRRIIQWAKDVGIEWALNPSVPMPSDKKLKSLPIESP